MLRSAGLFAEWLDSFDDQIGFWQQAEVIGQRFLDVVDRSGRIVDVGLTTFIGVGILKLFIGVEEFKERLQIALKSSGIFKYFHFATNARYFF